MADAANAVLGSAVLASMAGATLKRGYEWATGRDSKSAKRPRVSKTRGRKGYKSSRYSIRSKFGARPCTIRQMIPKTACMYIVSQGFMAIPAACAKRNAGESYYFDVTWNSLTTPWQQTACYDNGGMAVRQSTPGSGALGYQGLNQLLGGGSSYDSYCADSATLELWVQPNYSGDNGNVSVVPYKYFQGAYDGTLPVHIQDAVRSSGARTSPCNEFGGYLKIHSTIGGLFGVPSIACAIDPNFSARYTAYPANYANFRVLYNNNNDTVVTAEVSIRFKLTVKAKLFNADNTAIADGVVY